MLSPINLKKELIRVRTNNLKEDTINSWVQDIFLELDEARFQTLINIQDPTNSSTINNFNFDSLETNNIFHSSQIKQICRAYRLRFLDASMFKGVYPPEAISKIQHLEKIHTIKLSGFKVVAPFKLFKLKKTDDPMLFVPMGNNYYYLIHQWGNDLHPLRKLKYWAVKNVENFGISLVFISIFLTAISYPFFFNNKTSFGYLVMLFMFYFKAVVGISLFYGISLGKNFSAYSWNSKYDKVC